MRLIIGAQIKDDGASGEGGAEAVLSIGGVSPEEGPRIYVACLAAYNNSVLHGTWIDAAQSAEDIWSEVRAMLAASPIPQAE